MLKQNLNGQFCNLIKEVAGEEKWLWLRDMSIKRETESLKLWQHKNRPLGQTQ